MKRAPIPPKPEEIARGNAFTKLMLGKDGDAEPTMCHGCGYVKKLCICEQPPPME